jgi:hypothetical protein
MATTVAATTGPTPTIVVVVVFDAATTAAEQPVQPTGHRVAGPSQVPLPLGPQPGHGGVVFRSDLDGRQGAPGALLLQRRSGEVWPVRGLPHRPSTSGAGGQWWPCRLGGPPRRAGPGRALAGQPPRGRGDHEEGAAADGAGDPRGPTPTGQPVAANASGTSRSSTGDDQGISGGRPRRSVGRRFAARVDE